MNKMLTKTELQQQAVPLVTTMTRREKLLRWAKLIRETPVQLRLYSALEYQPMEMLNSIGHDGTAFALAATDPIFKDAGLGSNSIGDSIRFFELSRDELHYLSCDCCGDITNADMAKRTEILATYRGHELNN